MKHKCYEFGFSLSLPSSELQYLNKTLHDDPTMYLLRIYDIWKQSCCKPFTNNTIIEALENIGERKLADDVLQRL